MYLNDLPLDYEGFYRLYSPPRDRPMSNSGRNRNGIAPWGNGEKFLGNIRPLSNFNGQSKKTNQNTRLLQQQHMEQHNFIQSPQKSKKNRSNLGKLQKSFQNNKINQIHLNMSKIQFKQYQQNSFIENQNKKLFKTNPKINVKDFSSLDNNFFIKSYFFPNNFKSFNRKDQAKSLDNKKRKQYYKIKEIQAPTFLAIKSVDLKQKFELDQKDSDENRVYPLEREDFYTTYRTISVLSSRKKSHRKVNKSMNQNYKLKKSNDQVKAYHKTIQSTKQSSKQISESLRQRYRMVVEQRARKNKLQESNEIIFTNSSFIKRNLDEIHHSQETKITEEKEQVSKKTKKVSLSKQRQTRIDRLKKLRSKSDHENLMQSLTPFLEQKSIFLCKDQKKLQDQAQQNFQSQVSPSQSFRNAIQGSKRQRNQLAIYDQSILDDNKSIRTSNNSIFLLKKSNDKSFRFK